MTGVIKSRGRGNRAVSVLAGVSLSVSGGEVVLLEGPSGSGKTTLLALAAGLLVPDAGRIELAGTALAEITPAERCRVRARQVGFVFQRSNIFESLTVRQNILLMAELAGMERAVAAPACEELMDQLGVGRLSDKFPRELSGGEEQRVAVARALVHRPRLILADEPTGSLDGASGRAVADALCSIARARDSAVLVATHDARLEPFATRRLRIDDGRVEPA